MSYELNETPAATILTFSGVSNDSPDLQTSMNIVRLAEKKAVIFDLTRCELLCDAWFNIIMNTTEVGASRKQLVAVVGASEGLKRAAEYRAQRYHYFETSEAALQARQAASDEAIADVLIERLNRIVKNPAIRLDVETLLNQRISVSEATTNHPTIQVVQHAKDAPYILGFLGLLNGLVGTVQDGPKKGWGLIAAVFDDNGSLIAFERTASDTPADLIMPHKKAEP